MVYQRELFPKLEAELATKEVTIITGMRRVGKTTALLHLYDLIESKNKVLLDLENPIHRKIFEEENYDAIWNNLRQFGIAKEKKAFIFLDEVQYLPEISRVVKYLYDHWDVKFFLTGSSSFYLRNLFPESLAGRKIIFELFPLNFSEFLVFNAIPPTTAKNFGEKARSKNKIAYEQSIAYYREFLEFGGFPSVVLEHNPERKRTLLSEIFTSYFEKDAKSLSDFREMSKLRDSILLLVSRTASRVEIAKLANELAVSRETVYQYLSFLEQTYFIHLLPKYSRSADRQAAGMKKLFFCDCGIANILGKLSQGQLLEQSVFQNLRDTHALSYYNKEGGSEIDFIVDNSIGIEVKNSASARDINTLVRRGKTLQLKESYLVTYSYSDMKEAILVTDL